MYIYIFCIIFIFYSSSVYLCNYELTETSGTIIFPSYNNNIECIWIFNLSSISNNIHFRNLLLTFRHFDTEFGHDELFIGETIIDVSKYNSKLYRYSGTKLPDPCLIPLRGDILTRSIWIQFTSDHTNTGSGFIIDYVFQINQSTIIPSKSKQILIDAEIRHPLETKSKNSKLIYSYPYGIISSPNYPENYSDNIICRWHLYHRNAFIRLNIEKFDTEFHYDTLTLHIGQNINNRAMILYELSGDDIENKDLFIRNDNLLLIFNTDKTNNASGFSLNYEIIEKESFTFDIYDNNGIIHSKNYPEFLRTNIEYTWNIHMNNSNEIQINLIDIDLDYDNDYLQIITGEMTYSLINQKSFRLSSINKTKIVLRTKHSYNNSEYRGFNLTYQMNKFIEKSNQLNNYSSCGKKYSSHNGTIEFYSEISNSFNCLILIEVDDGQNIFLRFDYLNWDKKENFIDIGLFHDYNQYQIFHISDTVSGNWFIANDSQIWIRFTSSQYSLGISEFRLFYSETIQWSTISPEPYIQILDNNKLFPYQLISLPTNVIYHNLTQANIWHIEALDDECIKINFQSFQSIDNHHICFYIKDFFQIIQICTNEQFPFIYHHIGSCILTIEPEFIWMLVEYNIQIEKFKKITIINEIDFKEDKIVLTLPMIFEAFIHIEWLINVENYSSTIVFDIENFDGNTPSELILPQNENTTKIYSLEKISLTRFSHVLFSSKSLLRIIYKSLSLPIHNQKRLFRLNLYKVSKNYFNFEDFHYISYKKKQTNFKWTIHGQYENSTFLANLYSLNKNLSLQTTANVNLLVNNSLITIPSSDFDIRFPSKKKIFNADFLLILYEQQENKSDQYIILNKTSDLIQTNHLTTYYIYIQSTIFDSIDFIIIKADNNSVIHLYDLNSENNGYFVLNSSLLLTKGLSSLIGLRFSIKSLKIKIDLQSLTKTSIQLRYKTRLSSIQNTDPYHCFIIDTNLCKTNNTQTCNESCSNWFDYKSISMSNTRLDHLWSYALRGSVTLIIENTTIDNFEKKIYRNLRQSLAKIIRKYCLKSQQTCLSNDTDSIRSDHIIIQSYQEQLDDHRLYVSIFIKDPYRRTIALTNEQFLLAFKRYHQEVYQDIKYHINLPSNILERNSLDPIWLYSVCLLALLVLIVVILMLITILVKKTQSTNNINENKRKIFGKKDKHSIISAPNKLSQEDDEQICSSLYNETDSSQTSNSTLIPKLLPTTSYHHCPTTRPSYFHSGIGTAIEQCFENDDDDEPIPFIDDNISTEHSRKNSACWSDKTSLSSRFSLIWKLNRMRSRSQNRSTSSKGKEKQRKYHRTMEYTIPSSQQNEQL